MTTSDNAEFETTVYVQGLFSNRQDVYDSFLSKVAKLGNVQPEIWDNFPLVKYSDENPPLQYFLGSLTVSGTRNNVIKIKKKTRTLIKELMMAELTEKHYERLKSASDDDEEFGHNCGISKSKPV